MMCNVFTPGINFCLVPSTLNATAGHFLMSDTEQGK